MLVTSSSLFSPLDPDNPGPTTWIGGSWETAERLGRSYLEAADILADTWRSLPPQGSSLAMSLPIPTIQNYRHAIELILKAACLEVQRLVQMGGRMGIGSVTARVDLDERLGTTHSIARLVNLLTSLLDGLSVLEVGRQLPEDVRQTLRFLHDVDADGIAFRYATQRDSGSRPSTWSAVRPDVVAVDLESAIVRLHDAADMLLHGLGGFLSGYEDYLQDMWQEYSENLD